VGVVVDDVYVDGEMGVDGFHLVLVALEDTGEHVVDVRADRPHACHRFPVREVHFDVDGFFLEGQFTLEVFEALFELPTRTIYCDDTSVNLDGAAIWNLHGITRVDQLHGWVVKG